MKLPVARRKGLACPSEAECKFARTARIFEAPTRVNGTIVTTVTHRMLRRWWPVADNQNQLQFIDQTRVRSEAAYRHSRIDLCQSIRDLAIDFRTRVPIVLLTATVEFG